MTVNNYLHFGYAAAFSTVANSSKLIGLEKQILRLTPQDGIITNPVDEGNFLMIRHIIQEHYGYTRKNPDAILFPLFAVSKYYINLALLICSDLWKPYLKVIKRKVPDAVHVLDRFHIMKYLNEAVDNTRRRETSQLKKDGYEPILEKSRWCWLKNKKNRTNSQIAKLRELVQYNLKTVRCYLLKEEFQHLWTYKSRRGAERYFQDWSTKAMRSKLPEIKKVAKRLRRHKELLLNCFDIKNRVSNSIVEGFNFKAKLTMRKSYGFRTFNAIEVALYHTLGGLPEPLLTHRFY